MYHGVLRIIRYRFIGSSGFRKASSVWFLFAAYVNRLFKFQFIWFVTDMSRIILVSYQFERKFRRQVLGVDASEKTNNSLNYRYGREVKKPEIDKKLLKQLYSKMRSYIRTILRNNCNTIHTDESGLKWASNVAASTSLSIFNLQSIFTVDWAIRNCFAISTHSRKQKNNGLTSMSFEWPFPGNWVLI